MIICVQPAAAFPYRRSDNPSEGLAFYGRHRFHGSCIAAYHPLFIHNGVTILLIQEGMDGIGGNQRGRDFNFVSNLHPLRLEVFLIRAEGFFIRQIERYQPCRIGILAYLPLFPPPPLLPDVRIKTRLQAPLKYLQTFQFESSLPMELSRQAMRPHPPEVKHARQLRRQTCPAIPQGRWKVMPSARPPCRITPLRLQ